MPVAMQIQSLIFVLITAILFATIIAAIMTVRSKKCMEQYIQNTFGKAPDRDHYSIAHLQSYHRYASAAVPNGQLLDDTTWNDLNMDDVFRRINVCATSVGEAYLVHCLHDMKTDVAELEKREALLQWLTEHPNERVRLQKILLSMGKRRRNELSTFLFDAKTKQLKNDWMFIALALLPLIGIGLLLFSVKIGIWLFIAALGINGIVYFRNNSAMQNELTTIQYFSALLHAAKSIERKLGVTVNELGFNFSAALKPFRGMGGLLPGTAQQTASDLSEAVILFFKVIFLTDFILYNRTVKRFSKYQQEMHRLYKYIAKLDTGISILSYRHSLPYFCMPDFHEENMMRFCEAYHPLLQNPVANSADIGNDCIITGSNASGKSTFLKTVAINNILAQTIHTCCAKQYAMRFSYVATSMALRDNILSGESYFITEIKSLKRLIQYCKEQRCTCFIDEILRGTNTPERIAASTAVLKMLHGLDSLCLVASHDIELTEILKDVCDNYHFSEQFENDAIVFDYLLKNGPSRSTNAIRLLQFMGFDREIVKEAREMAEGRYPYIE